MQKIQIPAETAAFIKLADALNAMENAGAATGHFGFDSDQLSIFTKQYSFSWDSMAERWTLVAEMDGVPDLCPFNQTREECREIDLCAQCTEVTDRMDETV